MKSLENTPTPVLILWDIDHTLIETRGVGRAAFADAFHQVTGREMERMPHITGRTEPDIYTATAALHGITTPPPFPMFADALADAYRARRSQLGQHGRILPGATTALAHLAAIAEIRQSVLTGNTRAVSRLKLETFGLTTHVDLDIGAYGDDDGHRPALVAIAQARASARDAIGYDRRNTVLIGDSPADIATAHHGGARVIAVAAGGTPRDQLAEADEVLDDLTDTARIERFLRSLGQE
ncbi:HAD family hydrolase [Nocardia yamanashiensis]|uniref:HAD family hydrolase n=1 Tax=Nocardia yamanashiensis TaxID=209247 RepID=UPI00082A9E89|nr:haloacid dehalogenase-like hydrolase [Nocardia yamanashiensis]